MSDLHQLGVSADSQSDLEKVGEQFMVSGLLKAREKTIEVLNVIRSEFKEGQSENDARLMALSIFEDYGVKKHWHRPFIRLGEGTVLSFHDPISESRLKPNDVFHLDLGPVWPSEKLGLSSSLEYEGDYGDTFVFGKNDDAVKMIEAVHRILLEAQAEWKKKKISGETIYQFMKQQAEKSGYVFVDRVEGHRVSDFPHHKYTRESLSKINFIPKSSLWVTEIMICHPNLKMGAFYEDLMV